MHTRWTVPADHPAFAGHFPNHPIVPGVVLLDQTLLLAHRQLGCPLTHVRLANAKFLAPVGPGEELEFSFQPLPNGAIQFTVRTAVGDVAVGSFTVQD